MTNQVITLILSALLVSSCVVSNAQKGAASGAAAGALVGQVIGEDSKATLIGAAAGAAIGYLFGSAMDKSDKNLLSNTYEYNPDRQTSKWNNPDSGNTFEVTPKISYVDDASGLDCREAEVISNVEGKVKKTMTTACRENGLWVFK
jgi:surface antigen